MSKVLRRYRFNMRRVLGVLAFALVAAFLLMQLIPYGHQHTNPSVAVEPAWNSPQTRVLAARACFDCHSNQTSWRWYTNIAPVSWLTQNDVDGGRHRLNFSEWTLPQPWAGQAAQAYRNGNMPPWYFLPLHPEAQLTPAERQALIEGFAATLGESPPPPRR